jgi:hypothetical protein
MQDSHRIAALLSIDDLLLSSSNQALTEKVLTAQLRHIYLRISDLPTEEECSAALTSLRGIRSSVLPDIVMITLEFQSDSDPNFLTNIDEPKNVIIHYSRHTSGLMEELMASSSICQHVGIGGVPVSLNDTHALQKVLESKALQSTLVSLDISPPNCRCQLIEFAQMQKQVVYVKLGMNYIENLTYLTEISSKHNKSLQQVLVKGLLQMGTIIVLPLLVLDTDLILLTHPFTNRRVYNAPTKIYRMLLDDEDMNIFKDYSFQEEQKDRSDGGISDPKYLKAPVVRTLTYTLHS